MIRRTRSLPDSDRMTVDRIRVTSVARTLVDLAASETRRSIDDHLSAARRLRLLDCGEIRRCIGDRRGLKGTGELKRRLALFEATQAVTRSELETRFLRLCFDAGLPMPDADVPRSGKFLDLLWREHRLIAEIDSYAFHHHRFDEDRIRDLGHLADGYRTIRVTDRMIRSPEHLIASLRTLLLK